LNRAVIFAALFTWLVPGRFLPAGDSLVLAVSLEDG
jgi:hypothetical protein